MLGHKYDIPGLVEYASPVATCRLLELDKWNTGYDDGGGDSWELHGDTRLYRVRTKPLLQYFNQLAVCIRAFLGMRDQIPFRTRKSSTKVQALILHDP